MNHNSIWKLATESVEFLTSHFYWSEKLKSKTLGAHFALGLASDFFISGS